MTDLLTMIRTVDPNDKAACGLINNLFYYFLEKGRPKRYGATTQGLPTLPEYTHSLDALKAVQEEHLQGWVFNKIYALGNMFVCSYKKHETINKLSMYKTLLSEPLPTMNIAWMDAIYQAIERKQNDENISRT